MFRMSWNSALIETKPSDPLLVVRRLIEERLPPGWAVNMLVDRDSPTGQSRGPAWRADAVFEVVAADQAVGRLIVEVKTRADPRDLDRLVESAPDQLLVVANYFSRRSRETLRTRGISYADATGNLRLAMKRPAVFIETQGAQADPWRQADKPLKSLRGAGSGTAVRALLDFRPPYGIRELAAKSGASPASLSRVAQLLFREKLLERDADGGIEGFDWEGVIRRWTEDYEFFRANRNVLPVLAPRGARTFVESLYTLQERYALSGAVAAAVLAPVPGDSVVVYVSDPAALVTNLDLRLAPGSAWNVLVAAPFGSVVLKRVRLADGLSLATPPQLAADLLSLPGRGSSEAEDVISWMRRNESDWRN